MSVWPRRSRRIRDRARSTRQRSSAHSVVSVDAGLEHLVAGARPPVGGREDLDLLRAFVTGLLDRAADAGEIDDAVAHLAAVEQEIARRHQPVADVVRQDAVAGPRDLRL